MSIIKLEVAGTPAPKGSARAFMSRGPIPRAILVPSGSRKNEATLKSWDQAVRQAATEAIGGAKVPPFVGVPLKVGIEFRMARPGGHWGVRGLKPSAPRFPATKPDLDKLTRATKDSLSKIVYDDDSRIVMTVLSKVYADPGQEGATITISRAD